jgi:hypothetical protein
MQVVISVKASEVRRVSISCRCGKADVVEIPEPVAPALSFHACSCGAGYTIQRVSTEPKPTGKWEIKRVMD